MEPTIGGVPRPSRSVPSDFYLATLERIETRPTKAGKLMKVLSFRFKEPSGGYVFTDFEVIGTTKDPQATDPKTWTEATDISERTGKAYETGARQFVEILRKAGAGSDATISQAESLATGRDVVLYLTENEEPRTLRDGVTPNPRAGEKTNELKGVYAVGERVPGSRTASAANGTSPVAGMPLPPAAVATTDED